MRELDFSENNLFCRWLGVKTIWELLQGEVTTGVKGTLERAMAVEVAYRVGCGKYERSDCRRDYRNGSYGRELLTQYGWIADLRVPRLRRGPVRTEVFARYQRRQRLVDGVLLEAFLLGHSTRKTRRVFGRLFGESVSAPTVSRIVAHLDADMQAFHRRPLSSGYRLLYLDGLWVTLRQPVKVKKVVLVALGLTTDGRKELLSFQLAASESEACWWGFISDLKGRGLVSPELVITDGAAGLVKAVTALYPRSRHQRCTVHKVFDAAGRVAQSKHRCRFVADALGVFAGTTATAVRYRWRRFCQQWSSREPKAVRSLARDLDACLVYLEYPPPLQPTLRTTNPVER
jgi:putative transposase